MKKLLIIFVASFCLFINLNNISASNEYMVTEYVEEIFEDGSYIETIIQENIYYSRASTTSESKTSTYKDSEGTILWSVKVSGEFTYTGNSAKCTYSSISTTCPSSSWKLSNKSASKSGPTAIASVTAKKYTFLGICTNTIDKTIKLTCNASGKLS